MFYKNISAFAKTFYNVEFKPGCIEEVPGYIVDADMLLISQKLESTKPKTSRTSKSNIENESKKEEES